MSMEYPDLGHANGESDSGAEWGEGDVWGDVEEALSIVGRDNYNEAGSCARSQVSHSSSSSSSSSSDSSRS
jgi:hypothetical protein